MSASSAPWSPLRALTASCRSSSSRCAFCGLLTAVAWRTAIVKPPSGRASGTVPWTNPHPEVEVNLASRSRKDKTNLQRSRLLASPQPLEPGASLRVELVGEAARRRARRSRRLQVAEERLRRELHHLPARRFEHRPVRRHEHDALECAVLRGEPFEQRVGVGREANRERPELHLLAASVEDDDAPRATRRD